ncbi:MAG: hypothetical protein AVDCRST_MAG37-571 [uncultured Rubrobacteraceae bacterium]|uniref:Uncharacterized protein n=1 Tax=uncultured Rubrobacteraceae bacterium TaxID=349277 RepID=A0A6J4Q4R2_9ACTN|nr:MAG: hypothetical protein AVDCRST_MAG37-571 [uncultured Rubrobacteraceae bacterium]
MTTSARLGASDTGGNFAVFTRLVAVFIGLTNLAVLAGLNGVDSVTLQREDVGLNEILPPVLAGLVTSEIVLRRLRSATLAEKFSDRYANSVFVVCLGGTLIGFLLGAALTLNRMLVPGPPEVLERMLVSLAPGLVGAAFGLVLGLAGGFDPRFSPGRDPRSLQEHELAIVG